MGTYVCLEGLWPFLSSAGFREEGAPGVGVTLDQTGHLFTEGRGVETFIGERIEVECGGEVAVPVSFVWRGVRFAVDRVEESWQDWGFASGAPRKRTWRLRRHRNYYRVLTKDGRSFEIYLDRASGRREWVLYREVEALTS